MNGKLYIVGTPIGNLKDITLRALEVLKSCDLVAAEDTRVTMRLLSHFEIKKPLISYHKFNEEGRSENILDKVKEGQIVALVSDAGMPGISDPGAVIIEKAVEEGIDFEVIPGPTAVVTALVNSTLDTTKFAFRGFFPRENKEREEIFKEIEGYRDTIINRVWFFQRYFQTVYFWIVILVLFVIGSVIFKKLKPHFADVL